MISSDDKHDNKLKIFILSKKKKLKRRQREEKKESYNHNVSKLTSPVRSWSRSQEISPSAIGTSEHQFSLHIRRARYVLCCCELNIAREWTTNDVKGTSTILKKTTRIKNKEYRINWFKSLFRSPSVLDWRYHDYVDVDESSEKRNKITTEILFMKVCSTLFVSPTLCLTELIASHLLFIRLEMKCPSFRFHISLSAISNLALAQSLSKIYNFSSCSCTVECAMFLCLCPPSAPLKEQLILSLTASNLSFCLFETSFLWIRLIPCIYHAVVQPSSSSSVFLGAPKILKSFLSMQKLSNGITCEIFRTHNKDG